MSDNRKSVLLKRYYASNYDIIKSEILMIEGQDGKTRDDIEEAAYALGSVREPFVSYDDPCISIDCLGDYDDRYK